MLAYLLFKFLRFISLFKTKIMNFLKEEEAGYGEG